MEFININRLKSHLREGELSARETAKYLAAQGALQSLVFIPTPAESPADWAFVAFPLVSVVGIYYCYRRNGGELGTRFAERYLAVGWVVGWRVALVAVASVVLTAVVALVSVGNLDWLHEPRIDTGIDVAALGLVACMYWRTGVHLRKLDVTPAIPDTTD
jgi:hypothetical protein